MKILQNLKKLLLINCICAFVSAPLFAEDEMHDKKYGAEKEKYGTEKQKYEAKKTEAREDVQEALQVLRQMHSKADVNQLLGSAKGVFVVPDYAIGALVVGGSGGEGVLLVREGGEWKNPSLYDIGGISAGLQAGFAAGSMAMILMSEDALNAFKQESNFSVNADAGLSIVNWSARTRTSAGQGGDSDVFVWTDTEGMFGELSVGVTNVNWDEEENREYYGKDVSPEVVINGRVKNPHQREFDSLTQR